MTKTVHRLIARTFLGPCPAGLLVNHKNGIKTDNRACNLEYVTKSQNALHGIALGLSPVLRGEEVGNARLSANDVIAIRRRAEAGERNLEISRDYGITRQYAGRVIARETWKHI
jgi:hypothetical protein